MVTAKFPVQQFPSDSRAQLRAPDLQSERAGQGTNTEPPWLELAVLGGCIVQPTLSDAAWEAHRRTAEIRASSAEED